MEIERPHRTTSTPPTTTSELFICFTSRLTKSSSMRLSSKSIPSPSPSHTTTTTSDPTSKSTSLSTSLSRRLRHNRSLRGAQSPAMFPSSSKKNRGSSAFAENPEPSSPKVTCIGQVRVKTRKQGKKMKMRACRSKRLSCSANGAEVSFRRVDSVSKNTRLLHQEVNHCQNQNQIQHQDGGVNQRNQKWVHLPLTICEALRSLGSEFSCLFPCKSSCFSSGVCGGGEKGEKEERESGGGGGGSCAVFRWLVPMQEGEEGDKRRDIELVVGEEEEVLEREVVIERECSRRRSIFDGVEFEELFKNVNENEKNGGYKSKSGEILCDDDDDDEGDEGGGRVSVCVPPKDALLLMRCRSDPLKMASLSRKLWDPPLVQDDDGEEVEDVVKEVEEKTEELQGKTEELKGEEEEFVEELGERNEEMGEKLENLAENDEVLEEFVGEEEQIDEEEQRKTEELEDETEEKQSIENRGILEDEKGEIFEEMEDEVIANECSIEEDGDVENGENEQDLVISNLHLLFEDEEKEGLVIDESVDSIAIEEIVKEKSENALESSEMSTISSTSTSLNSSEESTAESKFEEEEEKPIKVEEFQQQKTEDIVIVNEEERKASLSSMEEEEKPAKLPDCLLLMMCEPKLSMEVSKETWVCSTDFIRWLPERQQSKKMSKMEGSDETAQMNNANNKKKKPAAMGPVHVPVQQGRSSFSFSAGSVANLIEKKLVKTGTYEPFVLTRCKSAPIRPTGKISAPEMACGRKIEPHRPATFGVGF